MSTRVGAGLALGVLACALEQPPPLALPVGDPAVFAGRAGPVLERRCAEPSCHADASRPFALFAPGRRRADPDRLHLREPLTADEVAANARAVAGLALEPLRTGQAIETMPVLCKPLRVGVGGCGHLTGPLFLGPDDRDYRGLLDYAVTLTLPEEP